MSQSQVLANSSKTAELAEAARAIGAAAATRVREATAARRIPAETVTEMKRSGLLRVYNPERWGGYEMHMQDVLPLVQEVAKGCTSTAWVMAVYQIHTWLLSLFSEEAQREVFAKDRNPIVAAALNPKSSGRRVKGGIRIDKGVYPFCSGCDGREWGIFGLRVLGDGGQMVDAGAVLMGRDEARIEDDWFVSGLKATGSKTVIAENVFVPEHRYLSYGPGIAGTAPGLATNPGNLYRAAFVPMLVLNLTGPALGAAEAALAQFKEALGNRMLPLVNERQADAGQTRRLIAAADMRIEIARMLLDRAAERLRERAEAGMAMAPEERARVCLESTWAVRECLQAVEAIFCAGGAGVLMDGNPLQRAFQDVAAINVHGFLGHDSNLDVYGGLVLGRKADGLFL